ncbi:hypothetical protein EYB45_08525 [Erythrobacteraceae bacterium CFH 75059]|uniref:hypothetical protein n=1 Tax=Qipengyuania thermophila TaxID=2509361 RepID=UPI00101F6919|nr:hypothetical protein [Qipengyuania thermophila]TCD04281.1 hypothetical protein EYB45_08525 [Erythrobacteraceae bacterium CFH 75059]
MLDLVMHLLETGQPTLRLICFALICANLLWVTPLAMAALRRDGSSRATAILGVFMVLVALAGNQSAYLFEAVPDPLHWRKGANLAIMCLGCAVLLASRLVARWEVKAAEREGRDADPR